MGRLLLLGLIVAVFASALGVVFSTNESRKLFVELQGLQKVRDELSAEWGRLQLEQSTLTTHGKVEQAARTRLGMVNPSPQQVQIIRLFTVFFQNRDSIQARSVMMNLALNPR